MNFGIVLARRGRGLAWWCNQGRVRRRTATGQPVPPRCLGGALPGRVLLGVLAIAVLSAPARAQQASLPTPPGFEPGIGLSLGGVTFHTRLQSGITATSNVRNDPTEESDFERVLSGNVSAQSTWKRHALSASVSHVDQRAFDIDDQDRFATSGTLGGRIDLWQHWSVDADLMHQQSIVDQNDPQQFIGNTHGRTETDIIGLGVKREDAYTLFTLKGRFQDIENKTELDLANFRRISANDRIERDLTLQGGAKYKWGRAYIELGGEEVEYSEPQTVPSVDRDTVGLSGGVGVEFQTVALSGFARVIAFHKDYEAATIGDVTGITGTGELVWQVRDNVALAGELARTFQEQATAGSAGLYSNTAAIGVVYQPVDTVYIKAGPSYTLYEQQGLDQKTRNASFGATGAWQVHDRLELLLNANFSRQTVNDPALNNLEYDDATVTLSTVVTF